QSLDLGEIALPAGATLIGRVVDGAGLPLAGAWVLRGTSPSYGRGFDATTTDPAELDPEQGIVTGADGRFAILRVLPGELSIRVERLGFAVARLEREIADGAVVDLGDVELMRSEPLGGRVVTAGSRPVASVLVVPHDHDGRHPRLGVRTDADGRFELPWVPRGGELEVRDPNWVQHAPHHLPDDGRVQFQRVEVRAALPLVGIVRDAPDGTTIELGGGPSIPHLFDLAFRRFELDAEGRFEVARFVPGSWEITVRVGELTVIDAHPFDWRPGDDPLVLELPETVETRIAVHVVDELGTPV